MTNIERQYREELCEAVARINPDDEVSVLIEYGDHEATVTGKAWAGRKGHLAVGETTIRRPYSGLPGETLCAVLSHTPATPPQPKGEHVVRDRNRTFWLLNGDGTYGIRRDTWAELNEKYGPLTVYRPEGGAR